MGNIFNEDFRDFINQLNLNNVRYILVGGYSVILHGYARTTGDMDIWVDRTLENYIRIKSAFVDFGMSIFDMTAEAFLDNKDLDVFSFGRPPVSIDLMVKVRGLNFEECYEKSIFFYEEDLQIRTIHIDNLISAKKASGPSKDLNDLENLSSDAS